MGVPIPPSPAASKALLVAFAERGIEWHPDRLVRGLDPARQVALLSDGSEMPYDLFLGIPVHRAPEVVVESGLTVDGWIPVDPLTLETSFPGVYAVGDVTSVGTPKAGVFAEGRPQWWPTRSAQSSAATHRRQPTTVTGCATSSSVRTRWPASMSRSSADSARSAIWMGRPRISRPTRSNSVPAGSNDGSADHGPGSHNLSAEPVSWRFEHCPFRWLPLGVAESRLRPTGGSS